jgi:hypothetical protein
MTERELEKYNLLLAQGADKQTLDAYLRPRQLPPLDRRVAETAMRLDIIEGRIETALRERHAATRARLERLGFDSSRYRPLPETLPAKTHLERAPDLRGPTGRDRRQFAIRPAEDRWAALMATVSSEEDRPAGVP